MSGIFEHVVVSKFVKIGGAIDGNGGASVDGGKSRLHGLIVHGCYETTGAVFPVEDIVGALSWRLGSEIT